MAGPRAPLGLGMVLEVPERERTLRASGATVCEAIATGVRSYFVQYPPDGTRFKQERRSTLASSAGAGAGSP